MNKVTYRPFQTVTADRQYGKVIKNQRVLRKAYKQLATQIRERAWSIYHTAPYAEHVTEMTKTRILGETLGYADEVEAGEHFGFSVWQEINYIITGECVALYPKGVIYEDI